MERNREAVRLVADALQKQQGRRVARQGNRVALAALEDQLLLLGQPDGHEIRQAQRLERLVGGLELSLAAVDDDQIRKWTAVLEHAPVAALDHLLHRREIVQESFAARR